MRDCRGKFWLCLVCVATLPTATFSQKVKVGYDKSVNFSKFKTYFWAEPAMPPAYPLLYATVVGSIETELSSKRLQKTDKDGDLTLIPAGGVGFGSNIAAGTPIINTFSGPPPGMNATMWSGAVGPSALSGPIVSEGTLVLEFVDRSTNKAVWTGSVRRTLDLEKKKKSLELASKAVVKLLKQFPPRSSAR